MKNSVLLGIMIVTYLSYLWSVIGIFKKHEQKKYNTHYKLLQLLSLSFWIYSLYELIYVERTAFTTIWVSVLEAICLILFWYNTKFAKKSGLTIIFSDDLPKKLETKGLYRWVRHPFYCIYLCSYWIITFFLLSPTLFVLSTLLTYLYYLGAKTEESKFINSELKLEYTNYSKQVGMLFPKINRLD